MFTNSKLAKSVRLAIAFGAASSLSYVAPAVAQEEAADDEEAVEKIAVTGSRIRKADFVSNAPVTTIGAEQFELTATVNTEQLLNTLPQFVPGFDRTSNNPGNGTATANLRGLGTNRTLVLVNGTRAVPSGDTGAVDINSIPTALIQDVEVLTGGASAVYGSDAVAGVINFILKDDFEGVEVGTSYEVTEEGDAGLFSADFTIGGNFADGKGNVVFNMSYTDRDDLFQGDRDFSTTALFDDGNGGLEPGGSTGVPATSIFAGGLSDFAPSSSGVIFGQDGSVREFVAGGEVNDFYNYAPVNYLQLPQERHQITALGHYEIADNVELYGRAMFTDSNVPSQLAPTPIFETAAFTLDGNPFITPEGQQILSDGIGVTDADGNIIDTDGDGIADQGSALLRRRMEEVGTRRSESTFISYQFQTGIRGFFGDSSWSYDAYWQTGKVTNTFAQLGNINRDRWRQSLILATDENGQVILDANGDPSCADPSANGGLVGCTPMNIFGEGNISEEAADFVTTAVNGQGVYEQKIGAINISGDTEGFFELPGGPVGIAFGFETRDEDFELLTSQDLAAGTIAGFNGQAPSAGGYTVDEFYVETLLPVFSGAPFAESLDIELAYRSADYDTVGSVESYKIAGSWAPTEMVRVRAGFNTAVRAPNIFELFSPQNEGFPGANDPCSASGAVDTSQAVRDLCIATGVPADVVFSNAIDPASGQVRALSGGNPDLKEEEADTLTVGVVVTPMDNLSVSLDYFDIEIEDAIAAFGGGAANVLANCYDVSADSVGGLGSDFCNVINRRGDGTIDFVSTQSQNVAVETLKGYDLTVNYSMELGGGDLSVAYLGTYTEERNFTPFTGADTLECAGLFGELCAGSVINEPIPEYKHRATLGFTTDDYTVQLLWRYIGEVEDDDDANDYTVETIDGTNYFDLTGTYHLSENYRVTLGIDNLLDEEPPIIGDNDEQANTYPATYDVFGRTYSLSFRATF